MHSDTADKFKEMYRYLEWEYLSLLPVDYVRLNKLINQLNKLDKWT